MSNISIEPGFYFELDESGSVINSSSFEKVPVKYHPLVNEVLNDIPLFFLEKLNSLLIRGSISSGRAIPFISDADFVIVLNQEPSIDDNLWLQKKSQQLQNQYPFVSLIDFTPVDERELLSDERYFFLRINIKTNSFCLYGDNILQKLPDVKPGKVLSAQMIQNSKKELLTLSKMLIEKPFEMIYQGTVKPISFWCVWIMRVLLRSSIAFIMKDRPIYSNDVSTCCYEFCQIFPQYRSYMEKAFLWERNPTCDVYKLNEYISDFLPKYLALLTDQFGK